ncbi:hypothetical protein BC829DRAFT_292868 [Chytridium lagenaria]|nr:hypothetical protein BC829DRAFT_292868 [Chytridium lagenaria]
MEGEETTPLLRDEGTSSQSSSPHAARRSSTVFIDPDVAAAASFSADFESQSSAPRFFHQSTNLYQRSFSSHESLHSRRSESDRYRFLHPSASAFQNLVNFTPLPLQSLVHHLSLCRIPELKATTQTAFQASRRTILGRNFHQWIRKVLKSPCFMRRIW